MPDRQDHDLFPVVMIESDIGPAPEFDHPLAELQRHFFDGAANFRMLAQRFHALADRLDGTPGRIPALGS